jgi:hypothetical protein
VSDSTQPFFRLTGQPSTQPSLVLSSQPSMQSAHSFDAAFCAVVVDPGHATVKTSIPLSSGQLTARPSTTYSGSVCLRFRPRLLLFLSFFKLLLKV